MMISSSMSSTKKSEVGIQSAFGDSGGGEFGVKVSWNCVVGLAGKLNPSLGVGLPNVQLSVDES